MHNCTRNVYMLSSDGILNAAIFWYAGIPILLRVSGKSWALRSLFHLVFTSIGIMINRYIWIRKIRNCGLSICGLCSATYSVLKCLDLFMLYSFPQDIWDEVSIRYCHFSHSHAISCKKPRCMAFCHLHFGLCIGPCTMHFWLLNMLISWNASVVLFHAYPCCALLFFFPKKYGGDATTRIWTLDLPQVEKDADQLS